MQVKAVCSIAGDTAQRLLIRGARKTVDVGCKRARASYTAGCSLAGFKPGRAHVNFYSRRVGGPKYQPPSQLLSDKRPPIYYDYANNVEACQQN